MTERVSCSSIFGILNGAKSQSQATKYYKSDELLTVPFLVSLVLAVVIHHGQNGDDWGCAVLVLSGIREEETALDSGPSPVDFLLLSLFL